jgi:tetratricopeptide (TPR) repeat protein
VVPRLELLSLMALVTPKRRRFARQGGSIADAADQPDGVARMKSGNDHHREALKRGAVVATRDQAAAEFQAAIDDYVAAAMASPSPSVLYNLAQTYRAAGDYQNAIAQYRLFLERGKPGAGFQKLIECQIGAMAAELERAAAAAPPRGPGPEDDADTDPPRDVPSSETVDAKFAGAAPRSSSPARAAGRALASRSHRVDAGGGRRGGRGPRRLPPGRRAQLASRRRG